MAAPSRPMHSGLLVAVAASASMATVAPPPTLSAEQGRLELWFRDHFDVLWQLAVRLGAAQGSAEDVVQEAFITAQRRASDIVPGSERRFLIATTIKLCANLRRRNEYQRKGLEQLVDAAERPPDAEQLLQRKQMRELLDTALDALSIEQRAVFLLYEVEDFTVPEIAELLELPVGTVASRLGRARSKFSKAAARLSTRWPRRD